MNGTHTIDERLNGNKTIDSIMEAAEQVVVQMAHDHYSRCYEDEVCAACGVDTPLSKSNGLWLGMASEWDRMVETVEDRLEATVEYPWWAGVELEDVYFDAFIDAAVEPAGCVVCLKADIGEDDQCGHEMIGDPCPAEELR